MGANFLRSRASDTFPPPLPQKPAIISQPHHQQQHILATHPPRTTGTVVNMADEQVTAALSDMSLGPTKLPNFPLPPELRDQ